MSERCGYCGQFMALVDYGAEGGTDWHCARTDWHIAADPTNWIVNSLDTAVRVAKIRAGLDPNELAQPVTFIDHLDEEWRRPFWERQVDRFVEMETARG